MHTSHWWRQEVHLAKIALVHQKSKPHFTCITAETVTRGCTTLGFSMVSNGCFSHSQNKWLIGIRGVLVQSFSIITVADYVLSVLHSPHFNLHLVAALTEQHFVT